MLSFAQDYDHLPLISKVEVFDYALQNTEGNDLAKVCICLVIQILEVLHLGFFSTLNFLTSNLLCRSFG